MPFLLTEAPTCKLANPRAYWPVTLDFDVCGEWKSDQVTEDEQ